MKSRKRFLVRLALIVVLAAGAAVLIAPLLPLQRFAGPIQATIEKSLGRRVEIAGDIRFRLLRGVGISLDDVVIHEDPRAGAEPFAYVTTLEASLRLASLARGRIEFSSLRLVEPSLNLMKRSTGWNVQPLLEALLRGPRAAQLPEILVRDGRVNFKSEDRKLVVYFSGADLDINPAPGRSGELLIRFSGEPARTDRPAHGFGSVSGRGRLRLPPQGDSRLEMDLDLGRSAIAEILVLALGRDFGVDGFVASQAKLAGPLSDLAITGRLELREIERWRWLGLPQGSRAVAYRGHLDLLKHQLDLEVADKERDPLWLRLRAADLLNSSRWAASLVVRDLPMTSMLEAVRQAGTSLPPGLAVTGALSGAAGYSPAGGVQGRLRLHQATMSVAGAEPLRLDEGEAVLDGDVVRLLPATVQVADQTVVVEGRYEGARQAVEWKFQTADLDLDRFQAAWQSLAGAPPAPVLGLCRQGKWKGSLRYARTGAGAPHWSGAVDLEESELKLDGFAEPVQIASARLTFRDDRVELARLRAGVGGIVLTGSYRFEPASKIPHRFQLSAGEIDWTALEAILQPSLRRDPGFLSRTLRREPAALPEWLTGRRAEGTIQAESLSASDLRLRGVRARFRWDGTDLRVPEFTAALGEGQVAAQVTVNLRGPEPLWLAETRLKEVEWNSGRLAFTARIQTTGIGAAALRNLRSDGSFEARSVRLAPDSEWQRVAGAFQLRAGVRGATLRLTSLEAVSGADTYTGEGTGGPDGSLLVELASGPKQLRVAGKFSSWQLELSEPR